MRAALDLSDWQARLPCHYQTGVTIAEGSRFFDLSWQRIVGDVVIGKNCSHGSLQGLRIEQGCLRFEGLVFDIAVDQVWVSNAPEHGIVVGDLGTNENGNALSFRNVFASFCGAWGWVVRQQSGLSMISCNADQNGHGGMLFNGCRGTWLSPTCESNHGTGLHFYDCSGLLAGHFVHVIDGHEAVILQQSTLTVG